MTREELNKKLKAIITDKELKDGECCVEYDCGIAMDLRITDNMVDKLLERSPWRDHIVGFKRNSCFIDLVLDEEGQAMWKAKMREIQAWCDKYGSD